MLRLLITFCLILSFACGGTVGPGGSQTSSGSLDEAVIEHNILGTAYLGQFSWDDADQAFTDALALAPNEATLLNNLGVTRGQQNRLDEAREQFLLALEQNPDFRWAHYNLGLLAKNEGDFETAVEHFRAVATQDSDDLETQYNLGSSLARIEQPEEAERAFRTALKKNPTHVSTLYAFGQFLMQSGKQAEGIELIQLSEEIRTRFGGDTIGTQYGEQGVYAMGVDYPGDRLAAPAAIAIHFERGAIVESAAGPSALTRIDGAPAVITASNSGLRSVTTEPLSVPSVDGEVVALGAADLNDDGDVELIGLLATDGQLRLSIAANGGWSSSAISGDPLLRGGDADLIAVDKDHDGDLDLFWCANSGCAMAINAGNGQLEAVATDDAGIAPQPLSAPIQLGFSDLDNDRDVDLLVGDAAATRLFSNRRDGSFERLPDTLPAAPYAIVDLNKDGAMDLVTVGNDGVTLHHNDRAQFPQAVQLYENAVSDLLAADLDNDGFIDLILREQGQSSVLHNRGEGGWEARTDWLADANGASPIAAFDADGDGDLDLAMQHQGDQGDVVAIWMNRGGEAHNSITIDAEGVGDNRYGVGSKVEVLSGALRQKYEWVDPAPLVVGLGDREVVQSVRILWPGGVLQDEVNRSAADVAAIKQLDRKGTSCPLIYAWSDGGWKFVTDFLGGAAIGYQKAPGRFNMPDTDEYVSIESGLTEVDGRLKLRLNNQLEEVIWFDQAELVVVDHPAGSEIYPNERLMPAPPWTKFEIFASRDVRPIVSALDLASGRDETQRLAERDRRTVDGFKQLPFKGYAEEHTLEIDLGPFDESQQTVLLLDGWIDYADSSANIAAHQTDARLLPPDLSISDGGGGWQPLGEPMGFPAGLPKTMTVDLSGRFPTADHRVRIRTNMRIYWDRARLLVGGKGLPYDLTRVPAETATLRFGGFPSPIHPDGQKPPRYNPASVERHGGWKAHVGEYTGFGEVAPLLATIDDAFVTTRNGDEIELSFIAPPPPRAGFVRSYLLFADGFGKDMDPNSAANNSVGPLPFHGMPYYPYGDEVEVPKRPQLSQPVSRKVQPSADGLPGLPSPAIVAKVANVNER
jgi:Tfp pilus assembly protein PilF